MSIGFQNSYHQQARQCLRHERVIKARYLSFSCPGTSSYQLLSRVIPLKFALATRHLSVTGATTL